MLLRNYISPRFDISQSCSNKFAIHNTPPNDYVERVRARIKNAFPPGAWRVRSPQLQAAAFQGECALTRTEFR